MADLQLVDAGEPTAPGTFLSDHDPMTRAGERICTHDGEPWPCTTYRTTYRTATDHTESETP